MLDLKVTKFFFDADFVLKNVSEEERKRMSKFGAFVRTDAQRSLRPSNKAGDSAQPGEPPRSHTKLLRHNIFFSYDPSTLSVFTGPVLMKRNDGTPVPQLLEQGGRGKSSKGLPAVYRKFPFMKPAGERTARKFPELFGYSLG